jgi:hypothetical protein
MQSSIDMMRSIVWLIHPSVERRYEANKRVDDATIDLTVDTNTRLVDAVEHRRCKRSCNRASV